MPYFCTDPFDRSTDPSAKRRIKSCDKRGPSKKGYPAQGQTRQVCIEGCYTKKKRKPHRCRQYPTCGAMTTRHTMCLNCVKTPGSRCRFHRGIRTMSLDEKRSILARANAKRVRRVKKMYKQKMRANPQDKARLRAERKSRLKKLRQKIRKKTDQFIISIDKHKGERV